MLDIIFYSLWLQAVVYTIGTENKVLIYISLSSPESVISKNVKLEIQLNMKTYILKATVCASMWRLSDKLKE